jgi:cell division septal protein FtsQ
MRINLDRQEQSRKKRRRRRSQTFQASIALPQASPRGSVSGKQTRRRASKRRSLSKRRKAQRQGAAAIGQTAASRQFRMRAFLVRVPTILLLAGLLGLIVYVSADARFFVYEARIDGARHLKPQLIYRTAQVHEQNIFWIHPQKVAERLVKVKGIKAVRVRCGLPAQVSIEIQEREPIVMWRALTQKADLWLDEEGIVLPYHGDVNAADMIFVIDSSERHIRVGDRIEPAGIVQSVLQLAAALPGAQVFFYEAGRGLYFTQQVDGAEWPVYVGTSEDLPRKIQILQALTAHLARHNIQPRYIDVRWADHPVYGKPAGIPAPRNE